MFVRLAMFVRLCACLSSDLDHTFGIKFSQGQSRLGGGGGIGRGRSVSSLEIDTTIGKSKRKLYSLQSN